MGRSSSTPQIGTFTQSPFEGSLSKDDHGMAMTREPSPENTDGHQRPDTAVQVTEPMGSLYEVTRLRNIRSNQARVSRPGLESSGQVEDFIARGIIDEAEAEELYNTFHNSLNHYLWVGIEQIHTSLTSVRRSSQLLTATILTVTALHIPTSTKTFDNCYREFLSLISSSMFSRYHSIDDVRALCIAAFWLSDVSWKLSGHAIRVATELDVHNAFFKALEGDREAFLRARLWYMLYVCDHHFSIAYGRPPMISESLQIREHEQFLKLPFADALDYRILSQVALFQIMTRIHDTFAEMRLPQHDNVRAVLSLQHFPRMRHFNLEIDQWRVKWQSLQRHNNFIGTFPPKGIILYSYFAKLQLNSFAIRGISTSQEDMATERKEFVDTAISAAMSILTFVLQEADMRRALVGTPLYVHTMIAFASVFLLNVATIKSQGAPLGRHFNIDAQLTWHNVEAMVKLLRSMVVSDRHLIQHVAAGLDTMLRKAKSVASGMPVPRGSSEENCIASRQYDHSQADQSRQKSRQQEFWNDNRNDISRSMFVDPGIAGSSMEVGDNFVDDDHMMFMNETMLYDAFGTDTTNEVYNLLSNQFSC
ncbi:hypothetical protein LTR05_007930 [Lithohypha guttulata]|uniref:Xylanolytic transcriptional activator regulatory domain-containing protein n=1 Tax=Lithohypha guttulata TaxID=1690604 RepID=A0AAN7STJ7_9EURO|nr:hypothetical protein LTR05_007930 [Lithohypha guttulata]